MSALAPMAIPLPLAVLCCSCDYVREIGTACPCGSAVFIPLASWLDRQEEVIV